MIELNKIYNMDCLDGMKLIDDNSVDLIVTDPPYFLLNVDWDKQWENEEEYLSWCFLWMKECYRVLKPSGSFYVFQDWRMVSDYVFLLKQVFPHFQNWITWERNKGRSSSTNWKSSKEEILYFSKSKKPKFHEQKKIRPVIAPYKDAEGNPKGWFVDEEGNRVRWTGVGNVWHYTPPVWSSKLEKPEHPTQKPLAMIQRIIDAHTDEKDIVLDLFVGSGTTPLSCKMSNRQFIGFEINKKYFDIAQRRLEKT